MGRVLTIFEEALPLYQEGAELLKGYRYQEGRARQAAALRYVACHPPKARSREWQWVAEGLLTGPHQEFALAVCYEVYPLPARLFFPLLLAGVHAGKEQSYGYLTTCVGSFGSRAVALALDQLAGQGSPAERAAVPDCRARLFDGQRDPDPVPGREARVKGLLELFLKEKSPVFLDSLRLTCWRAYPPDRFPELHRLLAEVRAEARASALSHLRRLEQELRLPDYEVLELELVP